jgi:hypothetical protein
MSYTYSKNNKQGTSVEVTNNLNAAPDKRNNNEAPVPAAPVLFWSYIGCQKYSDEEKLPPV